MSVRHMTAWLLGAYLGVLSLIAFWPSPVDRPFDGQLSHALELLHGHGVPVWVDYGFVESTSNVLLFVPFGFLVALMLGRRRWWLAMVIGCAASCCIEIGQLVFISARTASLADVRMNTLGAVSGALLAVLFMRFRAGRMRQRHGQGAAVDNP